MEKLYILEVVTEKGATISNISSSIFRCIDYMKRNKNLQQDEAWFWCVTIASCDQNNATEPRIFFDWDGKFMFRKDDVNYIEVIKKDIESLTRTLKAQRSRR